MTTSEDQNVSRDHARSDDGGDECRDAPSQQPARPETPSDLKAAAEADHTRAWELHKQRKFEDGSYLLGRSHGIDRALKALSPCWRPIESAPRDGTFVLAVGAAAEQRVIRWLCEDHAPFWATAPGHYAFRPTHWQPLPQPPAAQPPGEG